jgi:hypothetical protein
VKRLRCNLCSGPVRREIGFGLAVARDPKGTIRTEYLCKACAEWTEGFGPLEREATKERPR